MKREPTAPRSRKPAAKLAPAPVKQIEEASSIEALEPAPRVPVSSSEALFGDVRALVEQARGRVAVHARTELALLHWRIGRRIRLDVLGEERAEYGRRVIESLAGRLTAEYGRGFSRQSLFHMLRFVEAFPEEEIVSTLSRQLGWSHFLEIIYLDEPLRREFYAELCRVERWDVRTLRSRIRGMLYERTAISKQPDELIRRELAELRATDTVSPDLVFRDPYLLDFLGLADTYSEKDLETAILRELERFLLELGTDFTFVTRQKRMTVDGQDYYLDLLFYHRLLRCLVAIELKLGRFQAADKGQMELYLGWLDRHDRRPGEEPPLGLILCAGKSSEHIELLRLEPAGIRVAEYLTELPSKDVLERKLHQAIRAARERLALDRPKGEPA
ncbi:MAG: PDDEXK nuclease domain-containing protein [Myxococcota bacterium]|nr:PDDEXK nuclease domain-containing protein [Myxococcota bacterium]